MASLLEVRRLQKAYNSPVLVDFDFDLAAGEVHALVGGNGAGKSTFARILSGLASADAGEIRLDGRPFAPRTRREAEASGVVMVLQELSIIPTLSIAENLSFADLPHRAGWINRRELRQRAQSALARVHLSHLDPDLPAGRLGVGHQQMLEIAIALTRNCRLLILDEPTAALSANESEELFARMRDLTAQGVGIIYVSHRMGEIRRVSRRVTILRDGRRVDTRETAATDTGTLVDLMTGRGAAAGGRAAAAKRPLGPVRLDVRQLSAPPLVRDVSLQVRAGEILGLSGLVGSGRSELLRTIFGADPAAAGSIRVDGRELLGANPAEAVAAGLGMIPEDRKAHGLLLSQSIRHNISLNTLPRYSRHGLVDATAEHTAVTAVADRLRLKCDSLAQHVQELSGGNQQKAVMSRWLLCNPGVLLMDEPTRGIDVPAKETIYGLLDELSARGCAIVMVSGETNELMSVCDRIAVYSAGRIVGEFTAENWSEEALNRAAFQGYLDA